MTCSASIHRAAEHPQAERAREQVGVCAPRAQDPEKNHVHDCSFLAGTMTADQDLLSGRPCLPSQRPSWHPH